MSLSHVAIIFIGLMVSMVRTSVAFMMIVSTGGRKHFPSTSTTITTTTFAGCSSFGSSGWHLNYGSGTNKRLFPFLLFGTPTNGEEEPDLFDYFDPLLSPHAYPDGITQSAAPKKERRQELSNDNNNSNDDNFFLRIRREIEKAEQTTSSNINDITDNKQSLRAKKEEKEGTTTTTIKEVDHFTVDDNNFDPFFQSPHSYTNGFDNNNNDDDNNNGDEYDPLRYKNRDIFLKQEQQPKLDVKQQQQQQNAHELDDLENNNEKEDRPFHIQLTEDYTTILSRHQNSNNNNNRMQEQEVDILDVFDPLRSPHDYPNGIPSTTKSQENSSSSSGGDSTIRVGILLMDHGSRNKASNDRLQSMAQLYQTYTDQDNNENDINRSNDKNVVAASNIVVLAAHMEIAEPSIPQQLQRFIELGVDEIICHPFFLSPSGRHVHEDIPNIIQGFLDDNKDKKLPIVTITKPTGSDVDRMVHMMNAIVQEDSVLIRNPTK